MSPQHTVSCSTLYYWLFHDHWTFAAPRPAQARLVLVVVWLLSDIATVRDTGDDWCSHDADGCTLYIDLGTVSAVTRLPCPHIPHLCVCRPPSGSLAACTMTARHHRHTHHHQRIFPRHQIFLRLFQIFLYRYLIKMFSECPIYLSPCSHCHTSQSF